MPRQKQTKGTCTYCQKEFSKGGVSKHLATCTGRQAAIAKAEAGKGTPETLFHLRIEDVYDKSFWLDLEMRGTKSLNDLDAYLRGIWLECCGHMSEFMLGGKGFAREIGMQRKIKDIFQTEETIKHIYDMGTSSETIVKFVATREGKPLTSKPIVLMFRNQMPEYPCMECDRIATHMCPECVAMGDIGLLCKDHVKDHPHEEYGPPFKLVNSPRVGMCGYQGPAEPPY